MKNNFLIYLFIAIANLANAQKDNKKIINRNDYYDNFNNKLNLNDVFFEIKDSKNEIIRKIYLTDNKIENYTILTKIADSLFYKKKFNIASIVYLQAIQLNNNLGKVKHRYNLACALASTQKIDESFEQLDIIISKGRFSDKKLINNEELLTNLKSDYRWNIMLKKIEFNLRKIQDSLNYEINHPKKK